MPEHHQSGLCGSCEGLLGSCGAPLQLGGCFARCDAGCNPSTCDWTCQRNDHFVDRLRDVKGLLEAPVQELRAPAIESLPTYIPLVQHEFGLEQPELPPVVALPTSRVFRPMRGGSYGGHYAGADDLRKSFHLSPSTRVLLISVAEDNYLERYWENRTPHDVPRKIAELEIDAMTIPNFSYFDDAPRTHTLWNRRRMAIVAEELSNAGVGVIPHLNALTQHDWDYWAALLRSQPQLRFVTKEFQTGTAEPQIGRRAFERLRWLQDEVERDLHPILVAGSRFLGELPRYFKSFTLVDSVPFMRAQHRHEAQAVAPRNLSLRWVKRETAQGEPLDELLGRSLGEYQKWVDSRISSGRSHADSQGKGFERRGSKASSS